MRCDRITQQGPMKSPKVKRRNDFVGWFFYFLSNPPFCHDVFPIIKRAPSPIRGKPDGAVIDIGPKAKLRRRRSFIGGTVPGANASYSAFLSSPGIQGWKRKVALCSLLKITGRKPLLNLFFHLSRALASFPIRTKPLGCIHNSSPLSFIMSSRARDQQTAAPG